MDEKTNVIGELDIGHSSRVVVSTWTWKGKLYGGFRKFVNTQKYSGGTESKMTLRQADARALAASLRDLQKPGARLREGVLSDIEVSPVRHIQVSRVASDSSGDLPKIDIREYLRSDAYTGLTKSGVRFSWDKLPGFIDLIERLSGALATGTASTGSHPPVPAVSPSGSGNGITPANASSVPQGGVKFFPEDFLPSGTHATVPLELGTLPLRVGNHRDGGFVVQDDSGNSRPVRNPSEGKFIVYAQMRGKRLVNLPAEPLIAFKAVAAYEVYCRNLRASWIADNVHAHQDRELATYQAKQRLTQLGLPDVA